MNVLDVLPEGRVSSAADHSPTSSYGGSIPAEPLLRLAQSRERPVDPGRIARAVREILAAVGEDPDREGLADTPARGALAEDESMKRHAMTLLSGGGF